MIQDAAAETFCRLVRNRWLDGHAWNPSTRHGAASCVKRAIHYAIAQGVLADDPLKALKEDRPLRRERILAADPPANTSAALVEVAQWSEGLTGAGADRVAA